MTYRPEYVAARDRVLEQIARGLASPAGSIRREEVADFHRAIGELIGVASQRGGARTREIWKPCPKRKREACSTCNASPGHGPYLQRKEGRRWVNVDEPKDARAARRARALIEHLGVEQEHARALLSAPTVADGFLTGDAAEAARREILRRLVS